MNALTAARQAAEAAYTANPNPANLTALQAAGAAEMKMVLNAFDAKNAAPRKALHTTTPVAPLVYRTAPARRKAAEMYAMQVRMNARPVIVPTPEMEAAYVQYLSDGIGDTDGYYAPVDRQSFFRLYF